MVFHRRYDQDLTTYVFVSGLMYAPSFVLCLLPQFDLGLGLSMHIGFYGTLTFVVLVSL
jgi:hypothetical protein